MTLTSEYGPFKRDLILVFVPEPAVMGLLGADFLGLAGLHIGRRQ